MEQPTILIDEAKRIRAASPELPLLRLHALTGLPPIGFALLCGVPVFLLMLLPIALMYPGEDAIRGLFASALFFGSSAGIISGCTAPVFRGACQDLAQLEQVIGLPRGDLALLSKALTRATPRGFWSTTAIGSIAGLCHSYVLGAFTLPLPYAISQVFAVLLLWIMMNWTIPFLIFNARLFSMLGRLATPDLLRPSRHAGFGAAALRPALFIIAVNCAYPLLLLGGEGALHGATLIGSAVSVVSVLIIIILPLRGIRRRIREQRTSILAELDKRLDKVTGGDIAHASAQELFELDAVLDMRERVAKAPAWPLDLDGVKRILLYVVLPPLTWAAAAVMEMMIDRTV